MNAKSLQELYHEASTEGSGLVFADRGARHMAPENTMPAFEAALKQGAQGLKLDVQLSADRIPVVHRGDVCTREDGPRVHLANLDHDQIRELDVGTAFSWQFRGTGIPSLDEVFQAFGARAVMLLELRIPESLQGRMRSLAAQGAEDLMRQRFAQPLAEAVTRSIHFHGMTHRVSVASRLPWVLEALKALDPRIRRCLVAGDDAALPAGPQSGMGMQGSMSQPGQDLDLHEILVPSSATADARAMLQSKAAPYGPKVVMVGPLEDPLLAPRLCSQGVRGLVTPEVARTLKALHTHRAAWMRA